MCIFLVTEQLKVELQLCLTFLYRLVLYFCLFLVYITVSKLQYIRSVAHEGLI